MHTGALLYPCIDRGATLFKEACYESKKLSAAIPLPLGGFFCNGVIAPLCAGAGASLFGSSSGFIVFSPKSARPPAPPLKAAEVIVRLSYCSASMLLCARMGY
jgi:hypothetical protein